MSVDSGNTLVTVNTFEGRGADIKIRLMRLFCQALEAVSVRSEEGVKDVWRAVLAEVHDKQPELKAMPPTPMPLVPYWAPMQEPPMPTGASMG